MLPIFLPHIQITSLQEGEGVPVGELTIEGVSSDDQESDCQVYADVNDMTPMRNVTAIDLGGGGTMTFPGGPSHTRKTIN